MGGISLSKSGIYLQVFVKRQLISMRTKVFNDGNFYVNSLRG